jgi:rfaE bifunctional protein nucleotidyltransferase chain/domain
MEQEKFIDEVIDEKITTKSALEYDSDYSDYVFVSGCFDVLHRGHLNLLFEAEKFGQVFVSINSDASIKRLKGKAPLLDEKNRLSIMASLECVSCVYLMDETDARKIVRDIKPKLWVLGDDHKGEDFSDIPCPVAFISRNIEPFSSSGIKEKINGKQ